MDTWLLVPLLMLLILCVVPALASGAETIFIKAVDFPQRGSWNYVRDQQAIGDGYLMGLTNNRPQDSEAATITVRIPKPGKYRLWVYSRDFALSPGSRFFRIAINGQEIHKTFGQHGINGWSWEDAGWVELTQATAQIDLVDSSANYARMSALILTADPDFRPPARGSNLLRKLEAEHTPVILNSEIPWPEDYPVEMLTPNAPRQTAQIANDRFRVTFYEVPLEQGSVVQNQIEIFHENTWHTVKSREEEYGYLLFFAESVQVTKSGQFPLWSTDHFETEETYAAGDAIWVIPQSIRQYDGHRVHLEAQTANGTLQITWHLPTGEKDPRVTCSLQVAKAGYYSLGILGPRNSLEAIDFLLLPFLYHSKRLPAESPLILEAFAPTPVAMVSKEMAGITVNQGLVVAPEEIPDRWVRFEDSRFGLTIRGYRGDVQPGLFAPVLGMEESWLEPGSEYAFQYIPLYHVGSWQEGYRYVVTEFFHLHDYRQNTYGTLNDAISNLIELIKDDTYGGWSEVGKGPYNIEGRNVITQASPLVLLQTYLLTQDEEFYQKRTLPTLEYLLSRGGQHYKVGGPSGGSLFVDEGWGFLGGTVDQFGTSIYGGVYALTFGRSPIFRLIGIDGGVRYQPGYHGVQSWGELLSLYQLTGEERYLEQAKAGADAYLQTYINTPQTAPVSWTSFINFQYVPQWAAFIDLYAITGETRYLTAAQEGAMWLITTLWTQPTPSPEPMEIRAKDIQERGFLTSPMWRGNEAYRTGSGKLGEIEDEVVPQWFVSRVGLGVEQPITFAQHDSGNIMLSTWAPDLMRLAHYTQDPFYAMVARNAIIGRYTNYPGYYLNQYLTFPMKPDYPYEGPDLTQIYYHHIPTHLTMTVDFLVSQALYRSQGQIHFPGLRQQGYAWFSNLVYGASPGVFYGDEGVWLTLRSDLITVDHLQVNYLTAVAENKLYIALMNEAAEDVEVTVTPSARLGREFVIQQLSPSGAVLDTNQGIRIQVPQRGLVALKLDGAAVAVPAFAKLSTDASANGYFRSRGLLEGPDAAILQVSPEYYDVYIWSQFTEEQVNKAFLHWSIGAQWQVESKTDYPFEFTIRVQDPTAEFTYYLEIENTNGVLRRFPQRVLTPATANQDY